MNVKEGNEDENAKKCLCNLYACDCSKNQYTKKNHLNSVWLQQHVGQ